MVMQNYLLRMAFDGGAYHGFQVQKNAVSVCETLQDAMRAVFGEAPDVKGCSRTDAGVHAREFCVSFKCETNIPSQKIPLALNMSLPQDIRVLSCQKVPDAFHARYSASAKRYCYVILNSAVDDVFAQNRYLRVAAKLNESAMQQAALPLLGKHDFCAFMSAGSSVQTTVRTIKTLEVNRRGQWVEISVSADGFLYNMVRIIAGTLLKAGEGKMSPQQVAEALRTGKRGLAGPTLAAKGLFLDRVFYPKDALFDVCESR